MADRLVVGCMTGTSLDALDAAIVRITGVGLSMTAQVLETRTEPLAGLATTLRAFASGQPMTAREIAAVSHALALLHARAILALCANRRPDLVAVHGQTVFHAPPLSWQLVNPAPIAAAIGAPVVSDLRAADLAHLGQGAPITPLADWIFLRRCGRRAAVANLGGFCNVTLLPPPGGKPDDCLGFDVCACNLLLDAVARHALGAPFDDGGRVARSGRTDPAALDDLTSTLDAQRGTGRSLGTGDEAAEWVARWIGRIAPADLARTACEGLALTVARAVSGAEIVALAGGGTRNAALVRALESSCPVPVTTTDALGLSSEFREAACMAVLGALSADRVPITLAAVTRRDRADFLSGTWTYP